MMAEYINRNALLEALCGNDASRMEDYYYNAIKDFPATDIAPVMHGKWIYGEDVDIQCSVCGADALTEGHYRQVRSNYCPHCGAKMDY